MRVKCKTNLLRGRGGSYGRETSRLTHFPGSRLTDGVEVVSLKGRPLYTPRKTPGIHLEMESSPGP
jgi:hypothetical protein